MTFQSPSAPSTGIARRTQRFTLVVAAAALTVASTVAVVTPAHAENSGTGRPLRPNTHFTMAADGSSGASVGGENIPNIDVVKKTIATYYGDPGTGIADKTASPYISEMTTILADQTDKLKAGYEAAVARGEKPAIVVDTDDTTLLTYDFFAGASKYNATPAASDAAVQAANFPPTPGMVDFVNAAAAMGYSIFGITGRSDSQKTASLRNLAGVGYTPFTAENYFTKWTNAAGQPSYVSCTAASCSTVEYKALTRKHIEDLGYTITLNMGDQWSDLQGGFAERLVKLPNPTYTVPSPDLPGVSQPDLAPRTAFTMAADGSSGATEGGEGIPNLDAVKKTIATYYGDPGTGIADKTDSPYIREMAKLVKRQLPRLAAECAVGARKHTNPAIVLDADDTTLWTYDMEVSDMHFNFNPAQQDVWVQGERFPATPSMQKLVSAAQDAGCAIVGLTGRNDNQKVATLGNLATVGYPEFTPANYYTKWTGVGASQQPPYITCTTAKCTTIEYKSLTRAHIESESGGSYDIVANFGDQFSDLIGGSADRSVKLPNPTYYLP